MQTHYARNIELGIGLGSIDSIDGKEMGGLG